MKTRRLRFLQVSWLLVLAVAIFPWILHANGITAFAHAEMTGSELVHESVIAGSWYPASPPDLRKQIQGFLDKVPETSLAGTPAALISPHAGYVYSGQVAAHAYKVLSKQKFSSVIIIGPSHHARFPGVAIYDRGGFRTPLGIVPLDNELASALKKQDSRIRFVEDVHTKEHSLEMQLPFLQVTMPGFKLVPLLMGDQDLATCKWLAEAVANVIQDGSVLVVASSDLSHYHPYEKAKALDQIVIEKVSGFDPEGLHSSLSRGECEACGGGPIVTAMLTARLRGATTGKVLHYANSGDVTGDRQTARGGVVGYMAGAILTGPVKGTELDGDRKKAKLGVDLGLTNEEKDSLRRIARDTIEARCQGGRVPRIETVSSKLKEPRGAFVTLQKNGELRGCIGHIVSDRPLVETISEMAVAAAFQDPRFRPVSADELKDIRLEISVLTPLRKIERVEEIQVGVHGIYMKRGGYSGLLLPQVATEHGWDRMDFLRQTCLKARLPGDAWKDGETEIYIFSADVF